MSGLAGVSPAYFVRLARQAAWRWSAGSAFYIFILIDRLLRYLRSVKPRHGGILPWIDILTLKHDVKHVMQSEYNHTLIPLTLP